MNRDFEKAWSDIYWTFADDDMVFDSYHHGLFLVNDEVILNGVKYAEVPF